MTHLDPSDPAGGFRGLVARQREQLARLIEQPMARLAAQSVPVWEQREALDAVLGSAFHELPYCTFVYATDLHGRQISDTVGRHGLLTEHYGRDRSQRPYMNRVLPIEGMWLSEAYLSLRANRPSISAVHVVRGAGRRLGFVGADFDLRDLPLTRQRFEVQQRWQQLRGDPAIRNALFQQCRMDSELDRRIDTVLPILNELITEHGVFQCKLHFSTNRAVVWTLDDPYRYRLLDMEMLQDPALCLALPVLPYPTEAELPADQVSAVLDGFRRLRFADETVYLRAGTINVFNGLISLNFSCDGTHYLPWAEFLDAEHPLWSVGTG